MTVVMYVRLCVRFLTNLTTKVLWLAAFRPDLEQHVASGVLRGVRGLDGDAGSRGRPGNRGFRKGPRRPASGFYGGGMTVGTSVAVSVR
jgi:hypothetical protein